MIKKIELELLFQELLKLENENKISLKNDLKDQLRSESTKHRVKPNTIMSAELKTAAKRLLNNKEIVLRKADKSNLIVILNKQEYIEKLKNIVGDESKFKKITRNPAEEIKKELNNIIKKTNNECGEEIFKTIIGDYRPGYLYGNVKIHKPNNPLRPIISQVPTPTYQLSKTLNQLITQYMPSKYLLKSREDFIDILRTSKPKGMLSSLDVESLFTNVPVKETIKIILENVYNHPNLSPPKVSKSNLEKMLLICTTKTPFKTPNDQMYVQIDGVSMGSCLGPTFANFYMCNLENKILPTLSKTPYIYARYVDDIFLEINNVNSLITMKDAMEQNSVLKFTYELNIERKIPFLDIQVHDKNNSFVTSVYRKDTNSGTCMNAEGDTPERYCKSVIGSYVRRAIKVSSTWQLLHEELQKVKQILVNNNYSNTLIDREINKLLNKYMQNNSLPSKSITSNDITVYYRNQFHSNYKIEERTLKEIIKRGVINKDNNQLKLAIYYKNDKLRKYITKNDLTYTYDKLKATNVVYQFKHSYEGSTPQPIEYTYIGMTTTTLSRRLTMHLQEGGIKHNYSTNNLRLDRTILVNNTTILMNCKNKHTLEIAEALYIHEYKPNINIQTKTLGKILRLYS